MYIWCFVLVIGAAQAQAAQGSSIRGTVPLQKKAKYTIPWTPDRSWSPYEWIRQREAGKRAVFHMHIPKVAGISFIKDILGMIPNGTGFFSAENCYQQMLTKPTFMANPEDAVITMLRSPRAHVLSQYVECADDKWGALVVPPDKRYLLDNFSTWLDHFSHGFTNDDMECYHPLNLQSRAFLCEGHQHHIHNESEVKEWDEQLSVQHMSSTFFVGLVEYYQESLCLFNAKVNRVLPVWCDCEDPENWASFTPTHERHKTRAHSVSDLSAKELLSIDALTKLDLVLYNAAQARFVREIRAAEDRFGVRILC